MKNQKNGNKININKYINKTFLKKKEYILNNIINII